MSEKIESRRIALFMNALSMGGAEMVMIGLAEALARAGHPVDLVLAEHRGELLDLVPPSVRIVPLGRRSRVATFAALPRFPLGSLPDLVRMVSRKRLTRNLLPLASYLRRETPRALITTIAKNSLLALWARHLSGVDVRLVLREANVFSLQHARGESRNHPILSRLARDWYPRADAFVAVSQGVADDLSHSLGIDGDRITTIHNPVDVDHIMRCASRPANHPWLGGDIPLVLSVGRLARQKDYATLLRAFAILRSEREIRLLVFGEGPLRAELEALSRELGVEHDVSFPGIISDPYPFMSRASCFVLSSAWEGFGNVLLEALACGCPVVSTDCRSGPAEILDGGRFGKLTSTGDPIGLAKAISETLAEPIDRDRPRTRAGDFPPAASYARYREVILGETV